MKYNMLEMPKIELHCHLDGSMNFDVTRELLHDMGEEYSKEQLKDLLEAPEDCQSLAEYLTRFDLPIRCIQTRDGLRKSAKAVALDAAAENVKYIEVRFAPTFSTNEGLKVRDIIESVQAGLLEAEAEADVKTGIIVCGMRHLPMETNLAMLKEARELYGAGVVACDIAGDEKAFPNSDYKEFFDLAKKLEMPYTIHSGECGNADNIRTSMQFGARRVGHGIAMGRDLDLIKECARYGLGVEMCPTSNLQTKAIANFDDYPIRSFIAAGVPISINTDNRTVSNTTITREIEQAKLNYGITDEEIIMMQKNAIEVSFADEATKASMRKWYE